MAANAVHGPVPRIDQYKYDLPGVVAQAEKALAVSPADPQIFQRGNALVLILPAEPQPKDRLHRPAGSPLIRVCPASTLRLCLAGSALWTTPDKRSKSLEATMSQPWVVETVLERGEWLNMPSLTGIVQAPTLRYDGTILDRPGYDEATGLFYEPGKTVFPPIPQMPTKEEAKDALSELCKPFQDFPFKEPYHRSAALAAVLTVLVRHAIAGHVPLFGVKAPTAGTGKTLLVDTIARIATGRSTPKFNQPAKEEEWNKQLFTCALEGDPLILIDNCTYTIASAELCKDITAETVKGRILGFSKNGEAPQDAVYFATGNNLRFRSDIVRRVIPIALQSPLERPETRTGFTIQDPLPQWTLDHRPALVCAALTILRAYHLAHDKPAVPELGSFEAWCTTICAPLVWLGLPNPVDGAAEIKDEDDDREQLRELLLTWYAIYTETETTLNTAKQDIALYTLDKAAPRNRYHALFDALKAFDSSRDPEIKAPSVASNLKSVADRLVCGKILTRGKTRASGGYPWRVTEQFQCSCVACVAISNPRARNGSVTNTGSSSQTATQATQQGGQSGPSANSSNGLGGSVAANFSYTSATQSPPATEENDLDDIPF